MEDAVLSRFKRVLDERLATLHDEVHEALVEEDPTRYTEVLEVMRGGGEVRVAERLHEFNLASIRRHVIEMQEVEAALSRIANGHFGVCTHCGTDIPTARLEVQPAAARCVSCQAAQEDAAGGL